MISIKTCPRHEGPIAYPNAEQRFFQDHEAFLKSSEYRPPKKGEWFLSGAIVEAYKAPNDLSTPYEIAIPAHKTGLFCRGCGVPVYERKDLSSIPRA